MDFLGTSIWIFDFLIFQMLPFVSIAMVAIFVVKIITTLGDTFTGWMDRALSFGKSFGRKK
jgi:ABC-type maltose transport system permease subunit